MAYNGPSETLIVKSGAIGELLAGQAELLTRNPVKTDLNDYEAVRTVASEYMTACSNVGCLPNFEGLAAATGRSRRSLYQYLEKYAESPTAKYIDRLRTAWASLRIQAADKGLADVTASIFVLLNSNLGFSNEHKLTVETAQSPLETDFTPERIEAARKKYIDALPEEQ